MNKPPLVGVDFALSQRSRKSSWHHNAYENVYPEHDSWLDPSDEHVQASVIASPTVTYGSHQRAGIHKKTQKNQSAATTSSRHQPPPPPVRTSRKKIGPNNGFGKSSQHVHVSKKRHFPMSYNDGKPMREIFQPDGRDKTTDGCRR